MADGRWQMADGRWQMAWQGARSARQLRRRRKARAANRAPAGASIGGTAKAEVGTSVASPVAVAHSHSCSAAWCTRDLTSTCVQRKRKPRRCAAEERRIRAGLLGSEGIVLGLMQGSVKVGPSFSPTCVQQKRKPRRCAAEERRVGVAVLWRRLRGGG
jgi:hypothetical protein